MNTPRLSSCKMFIHAIVFLALSSVAQQALAVDPVHASFQLDGCKNTGQNPLYVTNFICANTVYTSGNLGKGWNELDLVPFRLTTNLGKQATATTTYTIAILLDNEEATRPGFDVISVPVVNAALSDASCSVTASPNTGAGSILDPGFGGTDKSIYRLITITQNKETECVFDYYGRLALGSHLNPGASLHANLALEDFSTGGIGAHTVSIPVKDISAQLLTKDMNAQAATDFIWSVTKQGSGTVHFGDVCAVDAPTSKPVNITVNWTKTAAQPGNTSVITHVYATNPAARVISISGSDKIYKGLTQTTLLTTTNLGPINLAANALQFLVLTDSQSFSPTDSNAGSFNDVASVTYTDPDTGIPIVGSVTATASTQISTGSGSNNTADVSDTESISGTGLQFSVAAPSSGNFLNGYIAGTQTVGPVNWANLGVSSSGSITFDKTVYLAPFTIVNNGLLSDTATILNGDGTTSNASFSVNIDSTANVKVTINKTLPISLQAGETVKMLFTLAGSGAPTVKEFNIVGPYTSGTNASVVVDNLVPDNYAVSETDCKFINAANPDPGIPCNMAPNTPINVNLSPVNGVVTCSGHADFANVLASEPSAAVVKITNPSCDPNFVGDFTWDFTLTGPNGYSKTVSANSCGTGVSFGALAGGDYVMTETLRSGWDFLQVTQPDGTTTNQNSCAFTVHAATDGAKVFTCTFNNTKFGSIKVKKKVNNCRFFRRSFTFDLRTGAAPGIPGIVIKGPTVITQSNNPIIYEHLPTGNYQLCESGILPDWSANFAGYTAFNPSPNPSDIGTRCINVTVTVGNILQVSVNNKRKYPNRH